jgi:HrpA-like RNA helicase
MVSPISAFRDQIVSTVTQNPITIINSPNGSELSTQIPQYLTSLGMVYVAESHDDIAKTLAIRVSECVNSTVGSIVGYLTSKEKCFSKKTYKRQIVYSSNEKHLFGLTDSLNNPNQILIIDEVQEYSKVIESLIALIKRALNKGILRTKIVLMGSIFDSNELSQFFNNAPIINIPSNEHTVVEVSSSGDLVQDTVYLAEQGYNVLVFVPGKNDIDNTIKKINEINDNFVVLPLHESTPFEEQEDCFKIYHLPLIVVSTRYAQLHTSIPCIDAVVDSGMDEREGIIHGIRTQVSTSISKFDVDQRKIQAGKSKDGIYVYCSNKPIEVLPEYPICEINRSDVEQFVLWLFSYKKWAEYIDFFHSLDKDIIIQAKRFLKLCGAVDEDTITDIGYEMLLMPLSMKYARMLVEAKKYNVIDDVVTIISILENGSIKDYYSDFRIFTSERESDLLVELDLFNLVKERLNKKQEGIYIKNFYAGVHRTGYYSVCAFRNDLLNLLRNYTTVTSCKDREKIKRSCLMGLLPHLYNKYGDFLKNKDGKGKLDRYSVIDSDGLVIGVPQDVIITDKNGNYVKLPIINFCTKVSHEMLKELAPSSYEVRYHPRCKYSCLVKIIVFNRTIISEEVFHVANIDDCCNIMGLNRSDLIESINEETSEEGTFMLRSYSYNSRVFYKERVNAEISQ